MKLKQLAFSAVISAFVVSGATAAELRWDLANEYGATSLHAQTADAFIAEVAKATGGEIKITAHHGASLGYKSLDQFDAVSDGALQLASSSFVFWTGINPIFQLPSLPFLAPSLEDNRALYKVAAPYYAAALEKANQIFLFATPWPASGLWGKKPLNSLEALKGVHVRTYDVSSTTTMRDAGAIPVQLSWADTLPQLTTGSVDSVLTSADGGVSSQLWEHQSHFTAVNYAMPLQAVHMNKDIYDGLTEAQKKAVHEAAAKAEAFGWRLLENRVKDNYAKMRDNKMTIVEDLDASYLEALSKAGASSLDAWKTSFGPEAGKILEAYQAARQ